MDAMQRDGCDGCDAMDVMRWMQYDAMDAIRRMRCDGCDAMDAIVGRFLPMTVPYSVLPVRYRCRIFDTGIYISRPSFLL